MSEASQPKVRTWRVDREKELRRLRVETDEVVRTGETVFDWADRYGRRTPEEPPPPPPSLSAGSRDDGL